MADSGERMIDRLRQKAFLPESRKGLLVRYGIAEAAQLLGCSTNRIRMAEEDGRLPPSPSPSPAERVPERPCGMTLLSRESAIARVASGEVRQVTQLLLDPARVRVWPGNARIYANLTEASCRELIDSILAENGQKVPAVVRRVEGDPLYDYEVIAGTRRHWSISWLRANNYPDMVFVAQVQSLDDESAFRLADLENRARKDVSDLERARNYAAAIGAHYGGRQRRMAERLKLHESWLSKMLMVAALPDAVVHAFASPNDIQVKPVYPLAAYFSDESNRPLVFSRARTLHEQQIARRVAGKPPIGSADVIRQLLIGPDQATDPSPVPYSIDSAIGRPLVSMASRNRQGLTLRLHAGSGASQDEVVEAVRQMLGQLEAEGKGLKP
jgi:ParB family transcriptional regulator, chromosome partitioning protein